MSLTRFVGDRFAGTSSDIKPAGNLSDGARFLETDTMRRYVYIIASGGWVLRPSSSGGGGVTGAASGIQTEPRSLILCAGYTPTGVGPDLAEVPIPYAADGVTAIDWQITRVTLRVQESGGSPTIRLEKYGNMGAFVGTQINDLTLPDGNYEAYLTGFIGTVNSRDKIRFNVISFVTESGSSNVTQGNDDMSLDQAIYEPTTNKIFGVRAQWLFQFNATTAALENSMRFSINALSPSYITAMTGKIYCSTYYTPNLILTGNAPFRNAGDIYEVDATSFSSIRNLNVSRDIQPGWNGVYGWSCMANNGTGTISVSNKDADRLYSMTTVFQLDPSNIPAYDTTAGGYISDIAYDSFNQVFWAVDPSSDNIYAYDNNGNFTDNRNQLSGCFGVDYNKAYNKVYVVNGDETLTVLTVTGVVPTYPHFGDSTMATFHTNRTGINPYRVKCCNMVGNPYYGKVLIPAFHDDTVLVWDASTDNVANMVVKGGFCSPIDIVFTSGSAFAVQTSITGLKEIL